MQLKTNHFSYEEHGEKIEERSIQEERRVTLDYRRQEDLHLLAEKVADKIYDPIAAAIAKEMKSKFSIPSEEHKAQHDFIAEIQPWLKLQIEKDQARLKFCRECIEALAKWSLMGLVGFVMDRIYHGNWPD